MMIRKLQSEDRFAAMRLWQEIFCDSPSFAAFYFGHRYDPDLSFGAFEAGRLVSMALGRPFLLQNPSLRAIMISGVCTMPLFRRCGLMHENMNRLLQNASEKGFDLAILSPVHPDLYRPFGFKPLSYAVTVRESACETIDLRKLLPISNLKVPIAVYQQYCKTHALTPVRTLRDFRISLHEYETENGFGLQVFDGSGYVFFLRNPEGIEVAECFAGSSEQYKLLLRGAAAFSPTGTCVANLPIDSGLGGEMIRPIYGRSLRDNLSLEPFARSRSTYFFQLY